MTDFAPQYKDSLFLFVLLDCFFCCFYEVIRPQFFGAMKKKQTQVFKGRERDRYASSQREIGNLSKRVNCLRDQVMQWKRPSKLLANLFCLLRSPWWQPDWVGHFFFYSQEKYSSEMFDLFSSSLFSLYGTSVSLALLLLLSF